MSEDILALVVCLLWCAVGYIYGIDEGMKRRD
jgi:hypothetical protein